MSRPPFRPPPPRPMGQQAGYQAAQRAATRAASQNAQRATQMGNAQARQSFVRGTGRRPRGRRHTLPVRLLGLTFRVVFMVIWLAAAATFVGYALQMSKGH
jgi:hypothetical protein